jgi:hypothetical protein
LAVRTGEINAYGLGFGPQDVGQWRARAAGTGDHELAVLVAEGLRPETHLLRARQADYWVTYGRALARLRGRHEDAAKAFRRAEVISPHSVLRDPLSREILSELLTRTRRDSPAGRALQRMAYRAGLPGLDQPGDAGWYSRNVVLTKRGSEIELDPHATGSCVITFDEDAATAVRDTITEWLGWTRHDGCTCSPLMMR